MDQDSKEKIQPELLHGEELLWCGRPVDGYFLKTQDFVLTPFALVWTIATLFIGSAMTGNGTPAFVGLFNLPFLIIGLYLLVGRFFYERWQRKNTYYAVTPQRVLIKQTVFPMTTTSIALGSVSEVQTQQRANGRGDIILQSLSGSGRNAIPPRLENLAGYREVYETLLAAQSKLG